MQIIQPVLKINKTQNVRVSNEEVLSKQSRTCFSTFLASRIKKFVIQLRRPSGSFSLRFGRKTYKIKVMTKKVFTLFTHVF